MIEFLLIYFLLFGALPSLGVIIFLHFFFDD